MVCGLSVPSVGSSVNLGIRSGKQLYLLLTALSCGG